MAELSGRREQGETSRLPHSLRLADEDLEKAGISIARDAGGTLDEYAKAA
jgi:hypothetical protein